MKSLEKTFAELRSRRDTEVDAHMAALEAGAEAVEKHTVGEPEKIGSTHYEPAGADVPQPVAMTQVINFSVTAGDSEGELDVHSGSAW